MRDLLRLPCGCGHPVAPPFHWKSVSKPPWTFFAGIAGALASGTSFGAATTATNLHISTLTTGTVLSAQATVTGRGRYVTTTVQGSQSTLTGLDRQTIGGTEAGSYRPNQIGRVLFIQFKSPLLTRMVPALNLRNMTLDAMLNKISDKTGVNIAAAWIPMKTAGINASRKFSVRLAAQPVKAALARVLQALAPKTHMVVSADDNMVFINTRRADDKRMVTRTYWLADLLANLPRYVPPKTNLEHLRVRPALKIAVAAKGKIAPAAIKPVSPGGDYTALETAIERPPGRTTKTQARSPGDSASRTAAARPRPSAADAQRDSVKKRPQHVQTNILILISSTVRPKIWINHGGKATITEFGDRVIVYAPENVQALLSGPKHYNPNAAPRYITAGN